MNKYLFIVRGFSPDLSASGNLIKPLIDELSKKNTIHVLCMTDKQERVDIINGIKVFRVCINKKGFKLKRYLDFIHRHFFFCYKDNGIVLAIKDFVEKLDKNEDYTQIISVTYEEALGLIQSRVDESKKSIFFLEKLPERSRLSFIKFFQKKINLLVIKYIIKRVNLSFFLPIVFEELKKKNLINSKTICLEHPMVVNKIVESEYAKQDRGEKFNLIYAGGIDRFQRNPEAVLRFLNSFNSLNVSFFSYGNLVEKFKKENKFKTSFYDVITTEELNVEYKKIDFLITIGNKEIDIFPSKLFDCISTGIPIIHFSQHEDDPYYLYLENYKFSLILSYKDLHSEKSKSKFMAFMESMKGRRADFKYIQNSFLECTPEFNAEKLVNYIKK